MDFKSKHIANILTDFSVRMKISGYNERYRLNVIQSALQIWMKQNDEDMRCIRPLYRMKDWNKINRKREKEIKKQQWFRKENAEFTIFGPCTPNSKLYKMW